MWLTGDIHRPQNETCYKLRDNGQYVKAIIALMECTWVTRNLKIKRPHEEQFSFDVQGRFCEVTCEPIRG